MVPVAGIAKRQPGGACAGSWSGALGAGRVALGEESVLDSASGAGRRVRVT